MDPTAKVLVYLGRHISDQLEFFFPSNGLGGKVYDTEEIGVHMVMTELGQHRGHVRFAHNRLADYKVDMLSAQGELGLGGPTIRPSWIGTWINRPRQTSRQRCFTLIDVTETHVNSCGKQKQTKQEHVVYTAQCSTIPLQVCIKGTERDQREEVRTSVSFLFLYSH